VARLRARGTCALTVREPTLLEKQIADPDNLPAQLNALLASTITDVLGELSSQASDLNQVTAITEQTRQALQSSLEPKCAALGLQLKAVKIEAIESV
jgi:membrane protease subunit (stomatin/prohibitin family)